MSTTSQPDDSSTADNAPLSLSTVQSRYPQLFCEYKKLEDREKQLKEEIGESITPGWIACTNFNETLDDNGSNSAMKTNSDANKFCMFLWKCLEASETGSISGDACRQFDILNSAIDDTLSLSGTVNKFEHLLGWTAAATNHGLDALLYRGDPDRNRVLFKKVADEWKKVFNSTNVNDDKLRKFAIWYCECFQKLLKQAKKEYGDHASYVFNFIKKKRVRKVAAEDVGGGNSNNSNNNTISITAIKPHKDARLGLGIAQVKGASHHIKVTSIAPGSLFKDTDLDVGMIIQSVNNKPFNSFTEGSALLKIAVGKFSIEVARTTKENPGNLVPLGNVSQSAKKKSDGKRKSISPPGSSGDDDSTSKKAKNTVSYKTAKAAAVELLNKICAVEGVPPEGVPEVYDSCPEVIEKINTFLKRDGITKTNFMKALNLNGKTLNKLLASEGQEQAGNPCYKAAYIFFEKQRILDGRAKSAARLENEAKYDSGFSLKSKRQASAKKLPKDESE